MPSPSRYPSKPNKSEADQAESGRFGYCRDEVCVMKRAPAHPSGFDVGHVDVPTERRQTYRAGSIEPRIGLKPRFDFQN
jgi:hypothetical protein